MSKTMKFPLPVMGIDSLSHETSLIEGAVREAVNVDINRNGGFARRAGRRLVLPGSGFHSLYTAVQKGYTLMAVEDMLYRVNISDASLTPTTPLNSPDPLSYVELNGNLYISNKTTLAWIPSNSTFARAVGVPTPDAPALSAALGGLLPGKYGVTMTLVDDRGEEGGTCPVQIFDLPNGGGIKLSGLPVKDPNWQVFIYTTAADGEELHLAAQVPAVFPEYSVGETAKGGNCDTHGLVPMPPGDFVRWLGGRLYTAKNGVLRFSEALRPHLHNPAYGVIPFSGHISFVEAVVDGLYVGDSRGVWFLSGVDPTKFQAALVSTCRAVVRSSIMIPPEHFNEKVVTSKNPVALWLSTSGYVVGMEGGQTVELQPERVKVPAGMTGRTLYSFRKGRKQVITPVNTGNLYAFGIAEDTNFADIPTTPTNRIVEVPSVPLAPRPPSPTVAFAAFPGQTVSAPSLPAAPLPPAPVLAAKNGILLAGWASSAVANPSGKGLSGILAAGVAPGIIGSASVAAPLSPSIVSWLKFQGADGSTTITDETGRLWLAAGQAEIDTSVPGFGKSTSLYLPRTTDLDWVESTTSMSNLAPGTGDFAFQFWSSSTDECTLLDTENALLFCVTNSNGGTVFLYDNPSNYWPQFQIAGVGGVGINPFDGNPHYFCIQRVGGVLSAWCDTKFIRSESDTHDYSTVPAAYSIGRRRLATTLRPNLKRMWGFKQTNGAGVHTAGSDLVSIPSPLV